MTGLTAQGFVTKRLPQSKAEIEQRLIDRFGNINLAPETVFGQLVGFAAELESALSEEVEDVYQSQYPSSASQVNLDRVVSLNGITRLSALPTTVRGVVSGQLGTIIPIGSLAKNPNTGDFYEALATRTISFGVSVGAIISVNTVVDSTDYTITLGVTPYTINSGIGATESSILTALASALPVSVTTVLGSSTLSLAYDDEQNIAVSPDLTIDEISNYLDFSNTLDGPSLLPVGSLSDIETPVSGWNSVTNRIAGTVGRNEETDSELRTRRETSIRNAAKNTVGGITATLQQLDGVTNVLVIENDGTVTDPDGVPPQHIWAIVQGGTGPDIVKVISDRKAGGIGTFGGESDDVVLVTGQVKTINYDRPAIVPIHIEVEITGSSLLPSDYVQRVRDALVAYGDQLLIGEDVIFTRLYCPIGNSIDDDSYVSSLKIDIVDPPTGTANISIDNIELAQITEANIDVLLAP